jgi:hypothetical protein
MRPCRVQAAPAGVAVEEAVLLAATTGHASGGCESYRRLVHEHVGVSRGCGDALRGHS